MHDLLSLEGVVEVNLSLCSELYLSCLEGEEGVILSHTDVLSWESLCTSLSHDNIANISYVTMVNLDAEVFWSGVASVFG